MDLHKYSVQEAVNLLAQSFIAATIPAVNLFATTTNDVETELFDSEGDRIVLDYNSGYAFRATIVGLRTDSVGTVERHVLVGAIKAGANAASVAMVEAPREEASFPATPLWSVDARPDTTNGSLNIYFTGASGATIKVQALVELLEVTK